MIKEVKTDIITFHRNDEDDFVVTYGDGEDALTVEYASVGELITALLALYPEF